jgi:UDP-4-amino-4,6-dideoxy-N-acetyl-beta-L-altrosamine transaminase
MNIHSYSKQSISKNDIKSVVEVLESNYLTQGPKIEIFEKKIANFVKSKYAVAVNSATSGLHISCLSLDLKKNDYLWTTPNSFVASANCALYCGAQVDFVDINTQNWNIDPYLLEQKLKKTQKKKLPKILVAVHFAGEPAELKKIYQLSKKYKFKIIEDASHALGSKYNKNNIGSCKFSNLTVFSFHPVKPITTGEGGLITTNNKKVYEKLKSLRSHGINKNKLTNNSRPWLYEQKLLGYNYRMDEIQAALGISQLKKINYFLKKRNFLALRYKKKLKGLPICFQENKKNNVTSNHLFVINFVGANYVKSYDYIFNYMRKKNIFVQKHYIPIYKHPYYRKFLGKIFLKNTENYSKSAMSLPLYPDLTLKQQDFVINNLIKILKKIK